MLASQVSECILLTCFHSFTGLHVVALVLLHCFVFFSSLTGNFALKPAGYFIFQICPGICGAHGINNSITLKCCGFKRTGPYTN